MTNLIDIITIGVYFICQAGHSINANPEEWKQFDEYMAKFGKSYRSEAEKEKRFIIYKSNLVIINQLNKNKYDNAEYGETIFTDFTTDEFKYHYLLPGTSLSLPVLREKVFEAPLPLPLPSSKLLPLAPSSPPNSYESVPELGNNFVSWTEYNPYYPPVEDQGHTNFGSLFAVVGALSILYSAQQKQAINLSKQQYVDCVQIRKQKDGSFRKDNILEYLQKNYLAAEEAYPFRGNGKKGECDTVTVTKGVAGLEKCWSAETDIFMDDALRKSPVVSMVMGEKFQHYKSGIITDCPSVEGSNLAVVIVAQGVAPNQRRRGIPYYLLRTSWGPRYGILKGHVKIKRGTCGIERTAYGLSLKTKGRCISRICDKFRKHN